MPEGKGSIFNQISRPVVLWGGLAIIGLGLLGLAVYSRQPILPGLLFQHQPPAPPAVPAEPSQDSLVIPPEVFSLGGRVVSVEGQTIILESEIFGQSRRFEILTTAHTQFLIASGQPVKSMILKPGTHVLVESEQNIVNATGPLPARSILLR